MGKLLRVLSIIILLLSAGALTLGIMLFQKRELLKGRTQNLENTLIELSAFLEAKDADSLDNAFPDQDIDEVTAEPMAQPRVSDFWSTYQYQLEQADLPPLKVNRDDLMTYYKLDPITLKVQKDAQGFPITKGKGTMHDELQRIVAAADSQLSRLNKTRQQLVSLREEHVRTIEELNSRKTTLRDRLVEITRLNGTIADLEGQIRKLEGQIRDKDQQITDLRDEISQLRNEIAQLNQELNVRQETIEALKIKIKKLSIEQTNKGTIYGLEAILDAALEAGIKGKVVSVNKDWNYVVIELNAGAMTEIANVQAALAEKNVAGAVPPIELFLKRGAGYKEFVSKIRLVQIKSQDKLAIADILTDWQRSPVKVGDVVFY